MKYYQLLYVLILIVVEDTLRESFNSANDGLSWNVLILIVVEDTLRV